VESLFEKVQSGHTWSLVGGVHPPSHKETTGNLPIAPLPLPQTLIVPLRQHIGVAGKLLVAIGDKVLKGQPLTTPAKGLSLPVHAPSSGEITDITDHPIAHPSGLSEPCVVIKTDGLEQWVDRLPIEHYASESSEFLLNKIKMAGIAGMGGAGFPAFIKSGSNKKIQYLIINATECEPYISADDTLIQQSAGDILQGIDIIATIVRPEMILIGIEDDKPKAIAALKAASEHRDDIHIRVFPARYPSGGEKQLISILTGQQVPSGGLPLDIGMMVHNIGTLHAIYRAVICDEPLISRVVTVTGSSVKKPQNLQVLIGTPVSELLQYCQFNPIAPNSKNPKKRQRIIMGGPMMGFTLPTSDVPVVKISNCILAPGKNEIPSADNEMACIRCSACADACPVKLLPQQLLWYSQAKDYDKAAEYNLKDCIECGACSYVCPSEIPLVQYYRVAKAELKAEHQEKVLADKAKQRFEERTARLERDALERQEKQRLATEKRKQAQAKTGASSAVADALARVKAKKAKQAAEAAGTTAPEVETAQPLTGAAAAIAKAKAKKLAREAAATESTEEAQPAQSQAPLSPEDKKKASIAAAVARAKAKKLAKEAQVTEPVEEPAEEKVLSPEEKKKAAIAATVARAKAKKLAKEAQVIEPVEEPAEEKVLSPEEKKKAAIAATVARAKAKKLAKEAEATEPTEEVAQEALSPEEERAAKKKAGIAAAVARAKAKKLAKEKETAPADLTKAAQAVEADTVAPTTQSNTPEKQESQEPISFETDTVAPATQSDNPEQLESQEPISSEEERAAKKKAGIAAAVARAKAKKLAKEKLSEQPESQEPISKNDL
jgi:electron transport complex protein RnfC